MKSSAALAAVILALGAAASLAAAPPEPAVLMQLLGKTVEEPQVQDIIRSLGSLTIRQRNKLALYKFIDDGIQLVVNQKGVIEGIILYSQGAYNFKQYRGELPQGLTFEDTRAAVLNKLGKPDEETSTIDKHRVDVFAKHHLAVSYTSREEKQNGLQVFVLFLRKDYQGNRRE